jgi:hypothetical protein
MIEKTEPLIVSLVKPHLARSVESQVEDEIMKQEARPLGWGGVRCENCGLKASRDIVSMYWALRGDKNPNKTGFLNLPLKACLEGHFMVRYYF